MFWSLVILGIVGLISYAVVALYQVLVLTQVKDFKDAQGNKMKGTTPTFLIGDVMKDYFFPRALERKDFLHYGDVFYRWFFWKPTLMLVEHSAIHKVLTDNETYRKNTPDYQQFAENAELNDQSEAIKAVFSKKNKEILGRTVAEMAQDLCGQLVDAQGNGTPFEVYTTNVEYTREVLGTLLYGDAFAGRQIMTAQRELSEISAFRTFLRNVFPSTAKMAPSFFGIEQASELSAGLSNVIKSPAPGTTLAFLKEHRKRKEGKQRRKPGKFADEGDKEDETDENDEGEESDNDQGVKDDEADEMGDDKPEEGMDSDKEERDLDRDQKEFDAHRGSLHVNEKEGYRQDQEEEEERLHLRNKQSISNIIGFYTTGVDTTASVLTSAMYMLMRHQDIQDQLRSEIEKALDGGPVSYSKLKEVKLLKNVVLETLRLHPPYPILYPRISRKSDKLAGFTIPRKTTVIVDVVGHNRHPNYWSNPDTFDPTRFEKNPAARDYVLVWGSGPQEKVGKALGVVTLRVTLATLLLKYRLVCGAEAASAQVNCIKFRRSVGSLTPSPPLIGRVTAIEAAQ